MDLEQFRELLQKSAPNQDQLSSIGLSKKEVQEFLRSFQLVKRDAIFKPSSGGIVEHFFTTYDPAKIEIGMVTFLSGPATKLNYVIIGKVESDPLVIDKSSGLVSVVDLASPSTVLWSCADSFSQFLDALIPAADFLGKCIISDDTRDNCALLESVIEKCTSLAGGPSYDSFYRMLIGSE